jgi:hypothetical protein
MPCLGPAVTAVALCEDAFDQADGFLSFDLPAAGGCLTRVAGVLPERLRAHSGDQHVERAPCVTEVPVMIFRRRMCEHRRNSLALRRRNSPPDSLELRSTRTFLPSVESGR